MLLEGKNAVIYGGGGAIGGAAARAFAREGATVFLAGRTLARLLPNARHFLQPDDGTFVFWTRAFRTRSSGRCS